MVWPGRSERWLVPLLALTLWLRMLPAESAPEPRLARVLSIDADSVTVLLSDAKEGETQQVIVHLNGVALHPGIEPGSLIRLWPASERRADGSLVGARLTPLSRDLDMQDRTGVRARLMYGAERGFGGRRSGR